MKPSTEKLPTDYLKGLCARLNAGENVVIAHDDVHLAALQEAQEVDLAFTQNEQGYQVLTIQLAPETGEAMAYNRQDREMVSWVRELRAEHPNAKVKALRDQLFGSDGALEVAACEKDGKPYCLLPARPAANTENPWMSALGRPGRIGANKEDPWMSAEQEPAAILDSLTHAQRYARSLDGYDQTTMRVRVRKGKMQMEISPVDLREVLKTMAPDALGKPRLLTDAVRKAINHLKLPEGSLSAEVDAHKDERDWIESDVHHTPFLYFVGQHKVTLVPLYPADSWHLPMGEEREKTLLGCLDRPGVIAQTASTVANIVKLDEPMVTIYHDGFSFLSVTNQKAVQIAKCHTTQTLALLASQQSTAETIKKEFEARWNPAVQPVSDVSAYVSAGDAPADSPKQKASGRQL